MKSYCIRNARILLEDAVLERGSVRVEDGRIASVSGPENDPSGESAIHRDSPVIDAQGLFLGPGFVELHIHGCDDIGFESSNPDAASRLGNFLLRKGVTTFVPTLQCDLQALKRLSGSLDADPALAARVPGFYVEGPFVSRAKRGGILEETIRTADLDYLDHVVEASANRLRLMTVAPELPAIDPIIRRLVHLGIIPCWGHSECRVEQVPSPGVPCNVTHLFNGMSPISHKESGLAMLPFVDEEVYFELNGDGIHLNEASIRLSYSHLNLDRMILISDAVVSAGRGAGEFRYFDRTVVSGENGVRYLDGTLIGSNCLMPEIVRRFIRITGSPIHEAVRFATLNPCRLLGMDDRRGSIAVGKEADLVLFDEEFTVSRVFLGSE